MAGSARGAGAVLCLAALCLLVAAPAAPAAAAGGGGFERSSEVGPDLGAPGVGDPGVGDRGLLGGLRGLWALLLRILPLDGSDWGTNG